MKKWTYKIIDSKDIPGEGFFKRRSRVKIEEYLCSLGQDGWEIINIDFRELESRLAFTGIAKKEMD
jgi:hypothetical protein